MKRLTLLLLLTTAACEPENSGRYHELRATCIERGGVYAMDTSSVYDGTLTRSEYTYFHCFNVKRGDTIPLGPKP